MTKLTLPSGETIEFTLEDPSQLTSFLNALGIEEVPTGYYMSSSKGILAIEDMHIGHIKNAVLQQLQELVDLVREAHPDKGTDMMAEGLSDSKFRELTAAWERKSNADTCGVADCECGFNF